MMFASGDKKPKLTRLMTPTDFAFSIICFMVVSWSREKNSLFCGIVQGLFCIFNDLFFRYILTRDEQKRTIREFIREAEETIYWSASL